MSRYFVQRGRKPRSDWIDDDAPLIPPITVCDHEPVDTGLLDPTGETIWRGPDVIGFHNPRGMG